MNNIKDGWNNIDEFAGIPGYGIISSERFIWGKSISIYGKVRRIFIRDFIFKTMGAVFSILNLILFHANSHAMLISATLFVLLIVSFVIEITFFRHFKLNSDPGKSTRDNLISMLNFLERKFPLSAINQSSTYMFTFIPAILLYLVLDYGYLAPIKPMGYFVYAFICLTGMIFSYIIDTRQASFHINHIRVCLSDLNDNALLLASENIESKRKMDATIIVLIQVLILLGFLVVIAILKSIVI